MSIYAIVGYCLSAFFLGYAAGFIKMTMRKAVESLD